ncbi:hypothetical protein LPY66_18410 [Dehalobacter sp. DCM]|uniref:hypothetical protein n=1 Tax=Dehalobacter sp. DCM TaxID=2907827 RepID=UPI003081B917|nr:hypothetical protein LPY66_18410 [Dehalobacter sp. DCM]
MNQMGTPQIIYIVLIALSLGINIAEHGKPRSNNNAWYAVISAAITTGILIWGGFFS